jgi:S-DNA-T family DNA segregation ATPase FtsK/SpoIIIE
MSARPAEPTMRLDAVALTLFAAGLIVTLAILGQQTGPDGPTNLLGTPGAWLAGELTDSIGAAVYVLLASWFVLVVLLLLRHGWLRWISRLTGWLVLIPCAAVAADWIGPDTLGGPVTGSGGALGAWLSLRLEELGPPELARAVVGLAGLLGLVLAFDFAVRPTLRVAGRIARYVGRGLAYAYRTVRWLTRSTPRIDAPKPVETPKKHTPEPTHAKPAPLPLAPKKPPVPIVRPSAHKPVNAPMPASRPDAPYELPSLDLLDDPQPFPYEDHDQSLRDRAELLEKTFTEFGLTVRVVGIHTGPVITQYEISLETGLRVNKVANLADDIARSLSVPSVRIVAPIPGKNTVGIELPNEYRATVRLKELIATAGAKAAKAKLPLFLGQDTEGRPLFYDLAEMPHLLIAGRTGTGKSVCLNSIILSLLYTRGPDACKLIMIDPKRVEFGDYAKLPHLMCPVVKDDSKAEAVLAWAVDKMEERYELLSRARVRSIAGYNELTPEEIHRRVQPADEEERRRLPYHLPYIIIIVDEMGDLMMAMKKEVEGHIIRLAQKSRAAGIHLVVATQRPTVDVITGLIKSNLPARICFQVASRTDSGVVLDEKGAERLLGKGDMLFLQPGTSTLVRAQGTYVGDQEITRVVEFLEAEPEYESELLNLSTKSREGGNGSLPEALRSRDDLYEQAIEIVVREGRGSVSLLQRALGIGYGRAARLIDFMAEDGVVGHYNGSQARDVLYTPEQWGKMKSGGAGTAEP